MFTLNHPYSEIYVLTGSSGSGKSFAASIFEELGAFIISADLLAREVVKEDSVGLEALIKELGQDILNDAHELDRKKLHTKISQSSESRLKVEAILHPLIQSEAKKQFLAALKNNLQPIIYDCPLYFEKNLKRLGYKKSILIISQHENLVKRICLRDKINKTEAENRLMMQLPQEEKVKLADFVIENNGSLEDFKRDLESFYFSALK